MAGKLLKDNKGWFVHYYDSFGAPKEMSVYYKDQDWLCPGDNGKEINFEIVDEFTHPKLFENIGWGDGPACANIIKSYVD